MRRSSKRRYHHNMIYQGESGYIGYKPMAELDVASSFIDYIYGECTLASLESAKQNVRERLAISPLTRAVEDFISTKVADLTREFDLHFKRSYNQREKTGLSQLNESLDKWKNQFISEYLTSLIGPGNGSGNPRPPTPSLPSGKPYHIEVSLTYARAGIGVSLRPFAKFFDKNGHRIRPVPFIWISYDTNVAWVDPDLNIVNTFTRGTTNIWAQTNDEGLESNKITLEVVKIRKIQLHPAIVTITSGSRSRVNAICTLSNGETVSDVALIWTEDNPIIAGVSVSGSIFGRSPGKTTVSAGDDLCMAENNVQVVVSEGSGDTDEGKGRAYPKILISSVDNDPETDDEVNLSPDDPPVYQRPQDVERNIWWINSSAPLAQMYLDQDRGYGYTTREWRIYHVERYIEIIAQISMVSDPNLDMMEAEMWVLNWGERVAEIQSSVADSLEIFIHSGDYTMDA